MISSALLTFILVLNLSIHLSCAGHVEDDLLNWLSHHGGSSKGVGIAEFDGMGRGVLAVRNIREGDDVLKIPNKLIISVKNSFASSDVIHRKIAKMFKSQEQAVIGLLVYERMKANESLWAPYFEILPQYVSNFAFGGFLPAELQDEKLEKDAANSAVRLRSDFGVFQKTVRQFWPSAVPLATFDIYQWASAIIDSRALRFEGDIKLIPIADIFNYAPHPVPRKKSSGNFFLQHHKLNEKGLIVTADRDCAKGNQLFEDYGDNEDGIYAQFHGFVANENPFRCVEFKTDFAADFVDKPDSLRKLFHSLKINSNMRKCVDSSGDIGLGLIVYESALAFDEDEIERCEKAIALKQGDWNGIFELCGFSEVQGELFQYISKANRLTGEIFIEEEFFEGSLYTRFLKGIRDRLQNYARAFPTSLHYDEELLRKIGEELRFSSDVQESPFAQDKNLDKLNLSVHYRVAIKRHWAHLCCLYQASCCPETSDIAGPNVTDLDVVVESESGEPLYLGLDWENLSLDDRLGIFMEWFKAAKPSVMNVVPAVIPGFRIGTKATVSIEGGDVYLTVPSLLVMDAEKAVNSASGVSSLLTQLSEKYGNRDNFHELLFFLIYEYFSGGIDSFYWPYLALLPGPQDMNIPLMWNSDDDVETNLSPSVVKFSVENYRATVRKSFEKISKISLIRKFFGLDAPSDDGTIGGASVLTFENYRWATAILDSRSIWWNGERHLVPLLDLVNCAEGPPSHQVHSTTLSADGQHAVTKAGWNFKADEQVFEQYGQPNHIYFMYHGFVLPDNSFDCVNIEMSITKGEAEKIDWDRHRNILQKLGMRDRQAVFRHCLKEAVSEALWVFLALKLNRIEDDALQSRLGAPSKESAAALLLYLNGRLRQYEAFFDSNKMIKKSNEVPSMDTTESTSAKFLLSEYNCMKKISVEVSALLVRLRNEGSRSDSLESEL